MQIIIDIDEDIKAAITRMGLLRIPDEMQKKVDRAIQRSTPLPKGHGRLIDADKPESEVEDAINSIYGLEQDPKPKTDTWSIEKVAEALEKNSLILKKLLSLQNVDCFDRHFCESHKSGSEDTE